MAFPTLTEYQTAIQNPQLTVNDQVLKTLKARIHPSTGMPWPLSGGFSLLFIMEGKGIEYAFKCYTRDISLLKERYQAISAFFDEHPMEDFLAYEYQPEAISINGQWWPALKMDYLKADGLSLYIEENLDDPETLSDLQKKFATLMANLEKAGMAHGDLQHGNILVDHTGDLRLIDYDGMYTPNMSFNRSHEIGHENFQHPDRSEDDFHARLDRFSAIVIDLSLEALQKNPDLWDHYYNGENLILKRDDFEHPDTSEVLREIKRIEGLEQKAKDFILLCQLDMEALPSLAEWRSGKYDLAEWKALDTAASKTESKKKKSKKPVSQYPVISGLDKDRLLEYEGQMVTVYGRVLQIKHGYTKYKKPYVFINFQEYSRYDLPFKITIWSEGLDYLKKKGIDVDSFKNKTISFTGLMEEYMESPSITFSPEKADKINLVSGEERNRLVKEDKLWQEEEGYSSSPSSSSRSSTSHSNADYWKSTSQSNRDILNDIKSSTPRKAQNTQPKSSSGNCWIAGAVFDDPLHPRVMELRRWRDEVLRPRWWGRILIRLYYWTGPWVSKILSKVPFMKDCIKRILN